VVTTTIDIVQWYRFVCGDYRGYRNSRYSVMVHCFVLSLLWLNNSIYSAMLLCCVLEYCGYNNSRCSAMILFCVWSLLWLKQQ